MFKNVVNILTLIKHLLHNYVKLTLLRSRGIPRPFSRGEVEYFNSLITIDVSTKCLDEQSQYYFIMREYFKLRLEHFTNL